jgi:16S rRNA (guanine527-N7)-methyltransferase
VTSLEFGDRLAARAAAAGLAASGDGVGAVGVNLAAATVAALETYFRLLTRWNPTINLTALPLDPPTDKTFDRLLIEPLIAARFIADSARAWFDIGSGNGSPAIPMKIVRPSLELTMIESRHRRAAFLREVVRATLPTSPPIVISRRFEEFAIETKPASVDLVTFRAVRADPGIFDAIRHLLAPSGAVFRFQSTPAAEVVDGFRLDRQAILTADGRSRLVILTADVPRGTS